MNQLRELFSNLSDLQGLIKWAGYFGMTAIVFGETGLLIVVLALVKPLSPPGDLSGQLICGPIEA